jgi:sporulation protein YlmC with PRC-barrel domain
VSDPVSWLVVERGWEVVDRDGDKIGDVHDVVGDAAEDIFNGLVVSSGWLGRPRYVPAEQVAEITAGRVQLAVSRSEAERLEEHEEPPASLEISSEEAGVADRVADAFTDVERRPQPLTPWRRLLRRLFRRS